MSARAHYLIRFDDICPKMNWAVWRRVEETLTAAAIKPMLAVVPDNRDETLDVDHANADFWQEVRRWQGMGWTIGLHGYQHTYVTPEAGLIGLNRRSEFAGLSYREQAEKIRRGVEIFEHNGVRPDLWIAPAHSFDAVTLESLAEAGITTVSDGFFAYPGTDRRGTRWLPQQLWEFRPLSFGVWTVCYHCNDWDDARLQKFAAYVDAYKDNIIGAEEALQRYRDRRQGVSDFAFAKAYFAWLRLRDLARGPSFDALRRLRARRYRSEAT